jgi:hypothetical protein
VVNIAGGKPKYLEDTFCGAAICRPYILIGYGGQYALQKLDSKGVDVVGYDAGLKQHSFKSGISPIRQVQRLAYGERVKSFVISPTNLENGWLQ